ncbi:MAG: Ig-like domain-containing protein [Thermodesulfobacteriota bacterium]
MKQLKRFKSSYTTIAVLAFLLAVFLQLGPATASAAEDGGGDIAIISPADNAELTGGTVDVVFELRNKGTRGDHVHLYLDGKLVKPLHGEKVSYTISGLGSGTHSIEIKLATKGHKVLDAEDSVTVNMK